MAKLIRPKKASEWIAYHWVKDGRKGRLTQDMVKQINLKIKRIRSYQKI